MTAVEEVRKKDIVDSLYWDIRVDASQVSVRVEDGAATLSGTVPSLAARRAAEEDAWGIGDISEVKNQLEIEYPTRPPADDEIRSSVESRLWWSAVIDATKVEVTVNGGLVTLKGTVPSYWQRLQAEMLAEDVTGVLEVINDLTVTPTETIVDEDIARQIMRAFERNAWVVENKVTVAVAGGKVTLTGHVLTWIARNHAEKIAASVPGVIAIDNQITVK